ncbi:MAG: SIS domain-containing protein [Microbacteriaceae bacterium]|nr:SIS domain-containing protein [Microbacteriaceae bacterium]MCL2795541.1 SIS domain-containing protein [Microbacteriaceae bacterium]
MPDLVTRFQRETQSRLDAIADTARAGGLDAAIDLLAASLRAGGVLQAFGTGHSQAFAMEIAGRAGGLIPTHALALRDLVLTGKRPLDVLRGGTIERDGSVVDDLWSIYDIRPADVFLIASNSGVNGSIVGLALKAQAEGHRVIAVTSLQHTQAVAPKHPSGKRLSEVADVVIDNLAPYGDTTLELDGGLGVGAVSSLTAAFIAQLLTIGAAERVQAAGETPPLFISANIPEGDEHNQALQSRYGERIGHLA